MAYHEFVSEDGTRFGSFETFEIAPESAAAFRAQADQDGEGPATCDENAPGWYWWACFPGCMPDGDPSGPFATEQEAIDDANEGA